MLTWVFACAVFWSLEWHEWPFSWRRRAIGSVPRWSVSHESRVLLAMPSANSQMGTGAWTQSGHVVSMALAVKWDRARCRTESCWLTNKSGAACGGSLLPAGGGGSTPPPYAHGVAPYFQLYGTGQFDGQSSGFFTNICVRVAYSVQCPFIRSVAFFFVYVWLCACACVQVTTLWALSSFPPPVSRLLTKCADAEGNLLSLIDMIMLQTSTTKLLHSSHANG